MRGTTDLSAENRQLREQLAQCEAVIRNHAEVEAALRENQERYRALISALHDGIVLQDHTGAIVECNPRAEVLLGLTCDQMLGRTSIDPRWHAIHEDGSPFPGNTHPAMETLRTGVPQYDVIMGIHTPDERLTWLSVNAYPLLHADDPTPYAVVASFTDISRQRQLERQREKLLTQLQRALARTQALYAITRAVIGVEPTAIDYDQIVRITVDVLGADRAILIAIDTVQERVVQFVGGGVGVMDIVPVAYDELMRGLTGWVMRTGEIAYSPGDAPDQRESPDVQVRRVETNSGAVLVVPLTYQSAILGTLTAINPIGQAPFTPNDGDLLSAIGQQIASALVHSRLIQEVQQAALTDPLTDIYNRRGWNRAVQPIWEQANRQLTSFSVMVIDGDEFKRINDTYGHSIGDQVLQQLAIRCAGAVRTMDVLGRYGGEEFIIAMPHTDQATACAIAERVRTAVMDTPLLTLPTAVTLTISIGVAHWTADLNDLNQLVERADVALYYAKRNGRNQVQCWNTLPHRSTII